jgi:diguanylate cyclase (GGDEF)-like protein/PAS domain S-box-containing protein
MRDIAEQLSTSEKTAITDGCGPTSTAASPRKKESSRRFYLKGIALAALVVLPVATIQMFVVVGIKLFENGHINSHFFTGPLIVITGLGLLLGRVFHLRHKVKKSSEKFRSVADVAQEFIYLRTLDGHYDYVSPSCMELCGYPADTFYSNPNFMDKLIHPSDRLRWKNHIHHINNAGAPETLDIRLVSKGGDVVWISHLCIPVFNNENQQTGVRSSNLNITERKAFEERIEHLAYYDSLCDLPNRRSLEQMIDQNIERCKNSGQKFALLFLDLDRFKYINDSHGHFFGDKLLRIISRRLVECAKQGKVTRFGGDEFVIIANHITNPEQAITYAEEIISTIEEQFIVDGLELYLSGSIGIAFYPQDGISTDELIKNADAAMYHSKAEKQDKVYFFQPHLTRKASSFISIEGRIRKALEQSEFELYYQPKVSLPDQRIIGLEALARWIHPDEGVIPPDQFIPVAEETGLILPLGEQLMTRAFQDMKGWEQEGIEIPVAVNISGRQFMDSKFCDTMERLLASSQCKSRLLEIEITEQVFMRDLDITVSKLERIKKHGISVAVDDFGTGYSSLKYIKMLPVDVIKIDRSFIWGATEDPKDFAILKAIGSLCQGLSLKMVAEGIENETHQQLVQDIGCDIAQGFLFHKPLPISEVTDILRTKQS